MNINEKLSEGYNFINKTLWIIAFPILLDLVELLSYNKLFHTVYVPAKKLFSIKIGLISQPPSVKYILEDFPSAFFQYNNNILTGIFTKVSLFNVLFIITASLIISFLESGYMSVIGCADDEINIKKFFIEGNKNWFKFYIFDCIMYIPLLLMLINYSFIFLSFVMIIFSFVKYSIVVDEGNILDNYKIGIEFFFCNLGWIIKIALYFGVLFSMLSMVIYAIAGLGTGGVVIDIFIFAYLGAGVNKMLLEGYREIRNSKSISQ
jgi:hypothetical protein